MNFCYKRVLCRVVKVMQVTRLVSKPYGNKAFYPLGKASFPQSLPLPGRSLTIRILIKTHTKMFKSQQ